MHDAAADKPPRLTFTRGSSKGAAAKHAPIEDVLAKMAGKVGERRRAAESARRADHSDSSETF